MTKLVIVTYNTRNNMGEVVDSSSEVFPLEKGDTFEEWITWMEKSATTTYWNRDDITLLLVDEIESKTIRIPEKQKTIAARREST